VVHIRGLFTSQIMAESALRDNIDTKGNNSYYFAHANTPNGPVWDGKEEPKLLSRQNSKGESSAGPKKPIKPISEYSWADGNKVSIYLEFESEFLDSVEDGTIELESTSDSITFSFDVTDATHRLVISPLKEEIISATYLKKSDKFLIKLEKADAEKDWNSLKKKD
jgi:hypothetical protein